MSKSFRLGVIFTHPTQHHSPLWRRLSQEKDLEIKVFYLSNENQVQGEGDRELGAKEPWDVDLMSGYNYEYLKNWKGEVSPKVKTSLLHISLIKDIHPKNFDAMWISSFVTHSHRLAFFLCKARGIPVISQNDGTIMSDTGYYNSFQRIARLTAFSRLYNLSNYWLAIGNHNEIYLRYYGVDTEKITPAPYPFDRERFEKTINAHSNEVLSLRRQFCNDEETVLYGFAAKYIERKRPMEFIEAMKKAFRSNPKIKGILIGGGALEKEIQQEISQMTGGLINAGFVNQNKLPLYYAAMDVFVCPSAIDSHPLVVSEAMAAGCPVILSDRCGNWGYSDILQHRYNGMVYPSGNINQLTDCILELADTEKRKLYGKRAKEVVATQDMNTTASAVMTIIEKIKNCSNA
jgi:glycosyltransferase involved in cell wall biosynthesis